MSEVCLVKQYRTQTHHSQLRQFREDYERGLYAEIVIESEWVCLLCKASINMIQDDEHGLYNPNVDAALRTPLAQVCFYTSLNFLLNKYSI